MKTLNREKLPKITIYQNLTCWVVTLIVKNKNQVIKSKSTYKETQYDDTETIFSQMDDDVSNDVSSIKQIDLKDVQKDINLIVKNKNQVIKSKSTYRETQYDGTETIFSQMDDDVSNDVSSIKQIDLKDVQKDINLIVKNKNQVIKSKSTYRETQYDGAETIFSQMDDNVSNDGTETVFPQMNNDVSNLLDRIILCMDNFPSFKNKKDQKDMITQIKGILFSIIKNTENVIEDGKVNEILFVIEKNLEYLQKLITKNKNYHNHVVDIKSVFINILGNIENSKYFNFSESINERIYNIKFKFSRLDNLKFEIEKLNKIHDIRFIKEFLLIKSNDYISNDYNLPCKSEINIMNEYSRIFHEVNRCEF